MKEEGSQQPERHWFLRLPTLNIGGKIIIPYAILTWIVASIGLYVISSLVVTSIDERLTNQVLEAGRAVSDGMVLQEREHVQAGRAVAYTKGLGEALQAGDADRVVELAQPAAIAQDAECVIVADGHGDGVLQALRRADGTYAATQAPADIGSLWMVQALLGTGAPDALPQRGLALHLADQRYYYFTAVPVEWEGQLAGVVVVGTSLDTLLPRFKLNFLADVIVYTNGGQAVGTTFTPDQPTGEEAFLNSLDIPSAAYERIVSDPNVTTGENIAIRDRTYRLARGPLRVGDDSLGVFAVALPSNFVVEKRATTRNTYVFLFATATAGVFVVGYLIARRITNPLGRLVRTSQAVAEGDLGQRTGIVSGDEIGLLAATFDQMTGRLAQRTRALEEALGRMRAILSSIGDGVLLEDLEGNITPLNAAAEVMLNEMAGHALIKPLRELSAREESVEERPGPWLLERRRFEVGRKVLNAYASSVRTEDGEHLGTVIVLRDVTAKVEAERLKDAFVSHVSHELRTPLTAIKGYGGLLLSSAGSALTEEQRGFLTTICRHTDNLVAMINALLDFSEIEAWDTLRLRQQSIEFAELIEGIAEEWRPHMAEKGLAFEVEAPPDLPPVEGDQRRLRWAITNLVRNAWQYTKEGRVSLRLYERDGQVVLDVADSGAGIAPAKQQQLFERFYHAEEAMDDETRGIGLGLYVTKVIVEAHGGEIAVSSEEGVGSTFSIALPATEDH